MLSQVEQKGDTGLGRHTVVLRCGAGSPAGGTVAPLSVVLKEHCAAVRSADSEGRPEGAH